MIVYKPVVVDESNLISTTLVDVPLNPWYSGGTFAIGYVVSVSENGGYSFYESLQNSNTNNPPASSPLWWAYRSFTYAAFSQGSSYPINSIVYDPVTKGLYRSIAENNNGVLDPIGSPPWFNIGVNASTLPAVFNAGTTYALGDYVYYTASTLGGTFGQPDTLIRQFVFKSLQAGNLNNTPNFLNDTAFWSRQFDFPVPWNKDINYAATRVVYTTDAKLWKTTSGCKGVTPADSYKVTWVNIGTVNKWAAFDAESSSQSKASGSLVFTVAPGVVDAVALLNAEADLVQVVVRDGLGGAVIYDQSSGVLGNLITDWWEYFHSDLFIDRRQILFNDLPLSANAHITVTLTGTNIALGDCVFSRGRELGLTAFGLQVGIRDFSVVTEDGFGGQKFNKRRNRKTMKSREWIPRETFNRTFTVLSDLPATPCVWVAGDIGDLNEALMIKAWYKDFTTEIAGPYELYTSLELEGLT
jgi:hypothetical protein